MPAWTVTLSYVGYAAALVLSAAAWLAVLFQHVTYGRVELGLLDERWRDIGWKVQHQATPVLWVGLACGGLAFLLAVPALFTSAEPAPVTHTHRVYQMKSAGVLLCLLIFVALARGRMGAFDADVAAVAIFAWGVWVVAAGWHAHAAGTVVAGPAGWWLALGGSLLVIAGFAALLFLIWLEGGIRMF